MTTRMAFRKSVRQAALLRVLLLGMTKSGKSYTACAVAHHLAKALGIPAEQIGVIESEVVGERDKITSRFELNTGEACACMRCDRRGLTFEGHQVLMLDAPDRTPEGYCEAVRLAKTQGFQILVVDSISHEWDACLDEVNRLKAEAKKNRSSQLDPWREVTPKHDAFLRALTTYPGHVIATCRTKDKTGVAEAGGKAVALGEQPWQREGIEYEFDVAMKMSGGNGRCESRSDMLNRRSWEKPGADFADLLLRWAAIGETASRKTDQLVALEREVLALIDQIPDEGKREAAREVLARAKTVEEHQALAKKVRVTIEALKAKAAPAADPSTQPAPGGAAGSSSASAAAGRPAGSPATGASGQPRPAGSAAGGASAPAAVAERKPGADEDEDELPAIPEEA